MLEWVLSAEPGVTDTIELCGLNAVGSANSAMTFEFEATASGTAETVSPVGYDAQ